MTTLDEWMRRVNAQRPDAHRELWQGLVNARPIPASRAQVAARSPIAVRARLVWERTGLEVVETRVTHWTARDVLIELADARWRFLGVWLAAQDVRRRDSA
jgi:hypothetical protein